MKTISGKKVYKDYKLLTVSLLSLTDNKNLKLNLKRNVHKLKNNLLKCLLEKMFPLHVNLDGALLQLYVIMLVHGLLALHE